MEISPCADLDHIDLQPGCIPKYKYIQPPVVESFKPKIEYKRPEQKMENDTIYKASYNPLDQCSTILSRPKSFKPKNAFQISPIKMDTETVTGLSFPGHQCQERTKPIIPIRNLLFKNCEKIQDVTTQKHDFVPKPICKRGIIIKNAEIMKSNEPLAKETVHRLSFLKPENIKVVDSFKPITIYKPPSEKIDTNTTQKLSYQPVCIPKKESFPWAMKYKYSAPSLPVEKDTIYKLSFPLNCGDHRQKPFIPEKNTKILPDSNYCILDSVYKESYLPVEGGRPPAIIPKSEITSPNVKMDKNTCYKLSYPGHDRVSRTEAIKPTKCNLKFEGRIQDLTTQKHDFIQKPISKRNAIYQKTHLTSIKVPLSSDTTNKLSYMAPEIDGRVKSFKPDLKFAIPKLPMESDTTQKLSYQPVPIKHKENYPWAQKPSFVMPKQKMQIDTVQKLSYRAPGCFIPIGCVDNEINNCFDNYPKAAV